MSIVEATRSLLGTNFPLSIAHAPFALESFPASAAAYHRYAAAQRRFAELGNDRTTLRSIAAEAQVDQKLVGYFFGSKQALFVAATELPFDPGAAIQHVLGGMATRGARGWPAS